MRTRVETTVLGLICVLGLPSCKLAYVKGAHSYKEMQRIAIISEKSEGYFYCLEPPQQAALMDQRKGKAEVNVMGKASASVSGESAQSLAQTYQLRSDNLLMQYAMYRVCEMMVNLRNAGMDQDELAGMYRNLFEAVMYSLRRTQMAHAATAQARAVGKLGELDATRRKLKASIDETAKKLAVAQAAVESSRKKYQEKLEKYKSKEAECAQRKEAPGGKRASKDLETCAGEVAGAKAAADSASSELDEAKKAAEPVGAALASLKDEEKLVVKSIETLQVTAKSLTTMMEKLIPPEPGTPPQPRVAPRPRPRPRR